MTKHLEISKCDTSLERVPEMEDNASLGDKLQVGQDSGNTWGISKLLVMFISACLMSSVTLCINASKVNGKIMYSPLTVNLLVELTKLCISLVGALVSQASFKKDMSLKESLLFAVPAALYMIDNNLMFKILKYIDPATLSVVWNLKVLTTAFLFRVVLKRKFTKLQWIALVLLLLGLITTQLNEDRKTSIPLKNSTSSLENLENSTFSSSNSDSFMDPSEIPSGTVRNMDLFIKGMTLVVIGVSTTSMAGVYTEWILKRNNSHSFYIQNIQMYLYGVLSNVLALLLMDISIVTQAGFFSGYNTWTYVVILINSMGGISVAFIFKYLDNIAGVYAHAGSMILTMIVSVLAFDFQLTLAFFCGLFICTISLYLYHMEDSLKKHNINEELMIFQKEYALLDVQENNDEELPQNQQEITTPTMTRTRT